MAIKRDALEKGEVRLLNQSWERLQGELSPTPDLATRIEEHPALGALSVLTGRRELWELAVSAAGYVSQHKVGEAPEATIEEVVKSVAERNWGSTFPDLEEYMTEVATLDMRDLEAAAPIAIHGANLKLVNVETFSCFRGCWDLYQHDSERLKKCLEGCL